MGKKYFHKLPQFFATMNSRNNRSIEMKPNHVMNSDFMSILYNKPLREYKKRKFEIGDRVRNSKYDLPFRKGYKLQFTQEIFEIVAIATPRLISSYSHYSRTKHIRKFLSNSSPFAALFFSYSRLKSLKN